VHPTAHTKSLAIDSPLVPAPARGTRGKDTATHLCRTPPPSRGEEERSAEG